MRKVGDAMRWDNVLLSKISAYQSRYKQVQIMLLMTLTATMMNDREKNEDGCSENPLHTLTSDR